MNIKKLEVNEMHLRNTLFCSICTIFVATLAITFMQLSQTRQFIYSGSTFDLSKDWTRPFITDIEIL